MYFGCQSNLKIRTTVRLLPKQILTEEFCYYSDKSIDELKTDIQNLFDKTKGWNFSVNLTGKFISEFEFKMTPKWQLITISNFERDISYLNGQLFSDKLKRTRVVFTVRPNSIFLIFFLIFPIIGTYIFINENTNGDNIDIKIAGLVFTLIVPAITLIIAHFAKQGIKNRFVETFDLKPFTQESKT